MCQSIYFSLPLEKRWGGGVVGHDVILSTELLKGIAFHGDLRHRLCFAAQYGTELAKSKEFLFLLPALCPSPPTLPGGFYSRRVLQAAQKKEPGIQEVWESFISISYKDDLNLGKQFLVQGDGGQVLAPRGQGWGSLGQAYCSQTHQRIGSKGGDNFSKSHTKGQQSLGPLHFSQFLFAFL